MKHWLITIALGVMVTGCGVEPHEQHPDNFKASLQNYYDANSSCYLRIQLPYTVDNRSLNPYKAKYDALVAAGIVSFEKTGEYRNVVAGRGTVITELGTYSLNPEYQSAYEPAKEVGKGQIGCFTGRKIIVTKILNYTKPVDVGGYLVLEVDHEYIASGIPDWLDHPQIAQQYPQVVAELRAKGAPIKTRRPLALYKNGWVAQ